MEVTRSTSNNLFSLEPLWFALLFVFSAASQAVQPVLSEAIITDVTDRSFSLIWTSDQQGLSTVELYSDASATVPIISGVSSLVYDIHTGSPELDELNRQASISSIEDAAKALGIIKVTITGLSPSTDYFIKFSVQNDATLEATLCPDAGAVYCPGLSASLLSLTTELAPVRTTSASQLYVTDILLENNANAQYGELLLLNAETAKYPISSFVGDGVPVPYATLDLNNLYSTTSNQSLLLAGSTIEAFGDIGEGLVVRHYKGTGGSVTTVKVAGINQQTGALLTAIDRDYGDCNSDGNIDGYDHLLLSNVVAGILPATDFSSVAFHPLLCNLYKEAGIDSVSTTVVIDDEDKTRLEGLLIGKTAPSSLPETP